MKNNTSEPKKVVIVGGGFGAIKTALNLANDERFAITLLSKRPYFEYYTALYRSATGRSPLEVAINLEEFFTEAQNIQVLHTTVDSFDTKKKVVFDNEGSRYQYDSLVIAVGCETNYFHIEGLKQYSYGIKSIHEALELKNHLHDSLIKGHEEYNYIIIGAGPTGIELSAELQAYLKKIRAQHNITSPYKIYVIEAANKILPALPEEFTKSIHRRLRDLNVHLKLKTAVQAEHYDKLELPGKDIQSRCVVCTAGVMNNPLFNQQKSIQLADNHKVVVDEYMQAADNVYVLGDNANTPYSGMAQTAIHDGAYAATHIKQTYAGKSPSPYKPRRPVYAIPVGERWAAVKWGKLHLYGYPGWILRRLADLRLFITFLPFKKAIHAWRSGYVYDESCKLCKSR